jgi:hypothetical protein
VEQYWAFLRKDPCGIRGGAGSAGGNDVSHQQFGVVIDPAGYNSALCIERIRFALIARACDNCDETARIAGKSKGSSCAGYATTDD